MANNGCSNVIDRTNYIIKHYINKVNKYICSTSGGFFTK